MNNRKFFKLQDLTASLLADVCSNVAREPTLQPLSGESLPLSSSVDGDGARADVAVDGFWGIPHQRAFSDVLVVNPFSNSYIGRLDIGRFMLHFLNKANVCHLGGTLINFINYHYRFILNQKCSLVF